MDTTTSSEFGSPSDPAFYNFTYGGTVVIRACTNADGESVDVGVGIPDKAFVGLTLTREQALVLAATVRTQVSDPLPEGAVKRDDLLLAYDRLSDGRDE